MGRIPQFNVRYAYAKKKKYPCQTARLCLSYRGKRLFYTDDSGLFHGMDLTHFNSDGTLCNESDIPANNLVEYQYLSQHLQWIADGAVSVAEKALKMGFWEAMTSSDFDKLLNMWFQCGDKPSPTTIYDSNGVPLYVTRSDKKEIKSKEQEEHIKFDRRMYEGYWLAITEGRCNTNAIAKEDEV